MTVYQRETLRYTQTTCPSSRQTHSRCVCREGGLDIPGPPPIRTLWPRRSPRCRRRNFRGRRDNEICVLEAVGKAHLNKSEIRSLNPDRNLEGTIFSFSVSVTDGRNTSANCIFEK